MCVCARGVQDDVQSPRQNIKVSRHLHLWWTPVAVACRSLSRGPFFPLFTLLLTTRYYLVRTDEERRKRAQARPLSLPPPSSPPGAHTPLPLPVLSTRLQPATHCAALHRTASAQHPHLAALHTCMHFARTCTHLHSHSHTCTYLHTRTRTRTRTGTGHWALGTRTRAAQVAADLPCYLPIPPN